MTESDTIEKITILSQPEIQKYIWANADADPTQLKLKSKKREDFPLDDVITQIQSRAKAKSKLPTWYHSKNIIYPSVVSVEQTSSEITAAYKANLIKEGILADITGGFGIDSYYFSKKADLVYHIEKNSLLSEIAEHNFEQLNAENIFCYTTNGLWWLRDTSEKISTIYLDPSRRDKQNKKMVVLSDCEPNVLDHLDLLFTKSAFILIKTAPLLDINKCISELKYVKEVHVIAIKNECKEVLYILEKGWIAEPLIIAQNLESDQAFAFTRSEEQKINTEFSLPLSYLYEPNAAILKAGAFKAIANKFGLKKMHSNTHLYTSKEIVSNFPGRVFQIQHQCKVDAKALSTIIPKKKANFSIRNFSGSVTELVKKLGFKEGGNYYIFACTLINQKTALLICEKVKTEK